MVVGIDFDTKGVHWVLMPWQGSQPLSHGELCYRRKGVEADEAIAELAELFPEIAQRWVGGVAYVERGFGASRKVDWALGRVQGAVMACLSFAGVPYNEITLQKWRAELMRAKAGVKKEIVHAHLRELGYDMPTPDLFDALGIALIGQRFNDEIVARSAA